MLPAMPNVDLTDNTAFENFFREHFSSICTWCQFKFALDFDDAREAVHTGFIKLWENRHTLDTGQSPRAYLYKIIANHYIDNRRHQKVKNRYKELMVSQVSATTGPEMVFDAKQLAAEIAAALALLPPQMRAIFELSRNEGLTYGEIANRLQISIKTVETQMSRALAKLRQSLGRYLTVVIFIFLK